MKKFFYFMTLALITLGVTACSKDDDQDPVTVNFSQSAYELTSGIGDEVVVTATASQAFSEETQVEVIFDGQQVENVYSVSASAFRFAKGATQATLTIRRTAVSRDVKSVKMMLKAVDGVVMGTMATAMLNIDGANIYSFDNDWDVLADTREYQVELETATGKSFSFEEAKELPVEVVTVTDGEYGAAVEGVNFEFPEGKVVKFQKDKSIGTVKVKFLKAEKGHELLVLKIGAQAGLVGGQNPTLSILVNGQPNFAGTWQFKELVPNNVKYMNEQMGCPVAAILDGTQADKFTFERAEGGYVFTPEFTGKLKNYFTKGGMARYDSVRVEHWVDETGEVTMTKPKDLVTYAFDVENVNYNFSPVDRTMKTACVEFHFQTADDGTQELIMSIIDYDPTENTVKGSWNMTWKEISEMMKFNDFVISPFESAALRIVFVRAE
jgi:hypothetical protein